MEDKDKKETLSYKMGVICAWVLIGCGMAVVVGLTVRFLYFLF